MTKTLEISLWEIAKNGRGVRGEKEYVELRLQQEGFILSKPISTVVSRDCNQVTYTQEDPDER